MISPVGSFIVDLDKALMGVADGVISSMAAWVVEPLGWAACAYLLVQGVRLANGDFEVAQGLVLRLVRIAIIAWMATNVTAYNTYVRDGLATQLPNSLMLAIAQSQGGSSDVNSVAASFEAIYAQIQTVASDSMKAATGSVTGVVFGLAVILATEGALIAGAFGLIVMGFVFIVARLMIYILLCLGPLLIATALFDFSRVFLERAIGKMVSLILLQVVSFMLISLMIGQCQHYVVKLSNDSLLTAANSGALPQVINDLCVLIVWFVAAALATLFLAYKIAYSIGTGVALAGPSMISSLMLARAAAGAISSGGGGGGGGRPSAPLPNYSLSVNPRGIGSGGVGGAPAALPPPPPHPAIQNRR